MTTGQAEMNRESYWLEDVSNTGTYRFQQPTTARVLLKLKTAAVSSFIYLFIY